MEYQYSDNVARFEQSSQAVDQGLQGYHSAQPIGACPHCGYCPHCGRGNGYQGPYSPWPSYPYYVTPVLYGGSAGTSNASLTDSNIMIN